MISNRILIVALLVGGGAIGLVVANLGDDGRTNAAVDAAVADALAAVTPEPTPEPTPIPTPLIVEVEVAPPECIDAIDTLLVQSLPDMQFMVDVLGAYLDYPDENLGEFGQRVEAIIEALAERPSSADTAELLRKAGICRAAL